MRKRRSIYELLPKLWTVKPDPSKVQQEAPGRVNEIVFAWMQGEPVPGNTRPGGSDGVTE